MSAATAVMLACELMPWHWDEPWFSLSAALTGIALVGLALWLGQ